MRARSAPTRARGRSTGGELTKDVQGEETGVMTTIRLLEDGEFSEPVERQFAEIRKAERALRNPPHLQRLAMHGAESERIGPQAQSSEIVGEKMIPHERQA